MATTAADAPAAPAQTPRTAEKLKDLVSAATLQYSLKNFAAAAEHYADAAEIQAELNGEMAPENAELLFYYGRALYRLAVQKTDVLGGKVAQKEKKKPKAEKNAEKAAAEGSKSASANGSAGAKEETVESKPFFQLEGDGGWTDSEDEDEDGEGGEDEEEEEDDFENAYETFELSRVLYGKQLEALETQTQDGADKGKGKSELTPEMRAVKDKLADCHGFLAEISMESERFHDAVGDARKSLALQEELHPFEHENVSEAHYMLSLALELASANKIREGLNQGQEETAENTADTQPEPESHEIDMEMRTEALKQTEFAVKSVELRLEMEKAALSSPDITAEQKKAKEAIIKDKSEALETLKERVIDLKTDPKSLAAPDEISPDVFKGLIGGMLSGGGDLAAQKAKLAEVSKTANDLTSLVKTKKKPKAPAPAPPSAQTPADASSSKRKLEVIDETSANGKRAKTEEIA